MLNDNENLTPKEKEAKLCKLKADQGDPSSMSKYAFMLYNGEGVLKDAKEAAKYYKMAADKGDIDGLAKYGTMLYKGLGGLSVNTREAAKYIKMAADKGDYESTENYAIMLEDGIGIRMNKEEALKYYKISANQGNTRSMNNYAYMVNYGEGCKENKEEAAKYYKMAADNGESTSMTNYAIMLNNGEGIPMNKEEALKYFKMAIEKEDSLAMLEYAYMLFNGDGIPENKVEAVKYCKMAADKGNSIAKERYNFMLEESINTSEKAKEAQLCKIEAEKGDVVAMSKYALMLRNGEGVLLNKVIALKCFKMAADNGDTLGMINYASMRFKGEGGSQNKAEAAKYYKMAADKGDPLGMINIGAMMYRGDEIPKDINGAIAYFKNAAEKGNTTGMTNYAYFLSIGEGVKKSKEESLKYYKMAADNDNPCGMYNYAAGLFNGEGAPMDKVEAYKYCKIAADKGFKSAIQNLSIMQEECNRVLLEREAKENKIKADNGDSLAMNRYGEMLEKGEGVKIDKKEAVKYYKMSADKGNDSAMNSYGRMLENGEGIEMNKEEALKYYKMSLDKGNFAAMDNYASMLNKGEGIEMNKEEAAKYCKMAADNGNESAIIHYALMIQNGDVTPNDPDEMTKYFMLLIDKGNTEAMLKYAEALKQGKGVQKNKKEALNYYKMAGDKGDLEGYFNYALMLYTGNGVEMNKREAYKYFTIASDKGHSLSMVYKFKYLQNIDEPASDNNNDDDDDDENQIQFRADKMRNGNGVEMNKEEALNIYKELLNKGDFCRILDLAQMIYNGEGVPSNKEEALKYYKMAENHGIKEAKECIDFIKMEIEFEKNFISDNDDDYISYETRNKIPQINRIRRRRSLISLKNIKNSEFNKLDDINKSLILNAENGEDDEFILYIGRSFIEGINNFPKNEQIGFKYLEGITNKNIFAKKLFNSFLFDKKDVLKIRQLLDTMNIFYSSNAKLELAKLLLSSESFDFNNPNLNEGVNFTLAKEFCKKAAVSGNPEAMLLYGKLCIKEKKNKHGQINRNLKEAFIYIKQANQNRNIESYFELGLLYFCGLGVKTDLKKASEFFKISSNKGDLSGSAYYGLCLLHGYGGIPKNVGEGLRLIRYSFDHGNVQGITAYANYLEAINKKKLCFEYLKKAASRGFVLAISLLGKIYLDDDETNCNTMKAIKCLNLAIEEGSSISASRLSTLYKNGNNEIEPNSIEMMKFTKIAANLGYNESICDYIHDSLLKQEVVDINELYKYFQIGIYYGDVSCILNFGKCLKNGKYFPKNIIKSAEYFKVAADLGNRDAIQFYSEFLRGGFGIKKDLQEEKRYVNMYFNK